MDLDEVRQDGAKVAGEDEVCAVPRPTISPITTKDRSFGFAADIGTDPRILNHVTRLVRPS